MFTFTGIDITDLLVECAKIDDPRVRNTNFVMLFKERVPKFTDVELNGLYMLMDGINFGLRMNEHVG